MRTGRFFQIPERPADVDEIRRAAAPLTPRTRPTWLDDADVDYYRLAASRSSTTLHADEHDRFQAEVDELRAAGLVVDPDAAQPNLWRVYVPAAAEYERWSIGICAGPSPLALEPAPGTDNPVLTRDDVSDVTAVFVADPFLLRRGGRWFMFFEVLNWRANKGEIGLATSQDGRRWRYEQRVLVEPFHLSYPHVFEYDGEVYMVPESRQAGSVRLYRANHFPSEWSLVDTLLESDRLVDPTLFCATGRWWLFAGDASNGRQDLLRLYGADSLTGPWREHAMSPVVSRDARIARPAGRVVTHDRRRFRFAQNCQDAYGTDVRAFEISDLTDATYREVAATADPILGPGGPGWADGGMHHVDACRIDDGSWLACVDGRPRADDRLPEPQA